MTVRELIAKYCIVLNRETMMIVRREQAELDGVMEEIEARKDEIMERLEQQMKEMDEFEAKINHDYDTIPGLRKYKGLEKAILMAEEEGNDTSSLVCKQREILDQYPEVAAYIRREREEAKQVFGLDRRIVSINYTADYKSRQPFFAVTLCVESPEGIVGYPHICILEGEIDIYVYDADPLEKEDAGVLERGRNYLGTKEAL